ncbi:hypothetical protein ACQEVS_26345 [Streptomyces sp. CA-181903]|uniref:hypothetical protein n=1 Tax=Streptomyces sp. CA-181903 TaxID=3240055 RepID=UPI003D8A4623
MTQLTAAAQDLYVTRESLLAGEEEAQQELEDDQADTSDSTSGSVPIDDRRDHHSGGNRGRLGHPLPLCRNDHRRYQDSSERQAQRVAHPAWWFEVTLVQERSNLPQGIPLTDRQRHTREVTRRLSRILVQFGLSSPQRPTTWLA